MTRHNVKSRKEFMKHQLLPSPPESSEIKRKAKKKKKNRDKEGRRNHFLLLRDKRKVWMKSVEAHKRERKRE